MRNIRADLLERLNATVAQRNEMTKQLRALEARERCLKALLSDEERPCGPFQQLSPLWLPTGEATSGLQLREFILGSLADGHAWSLEALKEHACGIGLTTSGASGRALNITLVNLLRERLVMRVQDRKWRLRDQSTQLPLDLAPPNFNSERDSGEAGALVAS
jgi:hypothetical protein